MMEVDDISTYCVQKIARVTDYKQRLRPLIEVVLHRQRFQ